MKGKKALKALEHQNAKVLKVILATSDQTGVSYVDLSYCKTDFPSILREFSILLLKNLAGAM